MIIFSWLAELEKIRTSLSAWIIKSAGDRTVKGEAAFFMMDVETVFKALGDTNRLRIVNLLLHGELCVCDIQYVLENSQPNISRHLAYLKRSEMVQDRRDGYRVFYRLANANELDKKRLFDFLRKIFENEVQLTQDTERLKEAIANGSCTLSEWKPFSAIEKGRVHKTAF